MLCDFGDLTHPLWAPAVPATRKDGFFHLLKAGVLPAQGFRARGQSAFPQHGKARGLQGPGQEAGRRPSQPREELGPSPALGSPTANPGLNHLLAQGMGSSPEKTFWKHGARCEALSRCLAKVPPLPIPHIPSTWDPPPPAQHTCLRVSCRQKVAHITWSQLVRLLEHLSPEVHQR